MILGNILPTDSLYINTTTDLFLTTASATRALQFIMLAFFFIIVICILTCIIIRHKERFRRAHFIDPATQPQAIVNGIPHTFTVIDDDAIVSNGHGIIIQLNENGEPHLIYKNEHGGTAKIDGTIPLSAIACSIGEHHTDYVKEDVIKPVMENQANHNENSNRTSSGTTVTTAISDVTFHGTDNEEGEMQDITCILNEPRGTSTLSSLLNSTNSRTNPNPLPSTTQPVSIVYNSHFAPRVVSQPISASSISYSTKPIMKEGNETNPSTEASTVPTAPTTPTNPTTTNPTPTNTNSPNHTAITIGEAPQDLCCVCMDVNSNCLILPCGHFNMCCNCAVRLSNCPICRKDIEKRLQVLLDS